jgi:hypothetical protein
MTYRSEAKKLHVDVASLHRFVHSKTVEAPTLLRILGGVDSELAEVVGKVLEAYRSRLLLRRRNSCT